MAERTYMCLNEECGARGYIRVVNKEEDWGDDPKVCPFCDQQL